LSILNYDGDFLRFVFSGHSGTYAILIIRHHWLVPFLLAIGFIASSIYKNLSKKKWAHIISLPSMLIWVFSMQTYAIDYSHNQIILGWSFFKFNRCELQEKNGHYKITDCVLISDPILKAKLMKEITNE
jgi:hypothetical protein